ncbi:MAG: NHLP family bacteriocin export ABC transporter peptidase/permease/ATPase, partial [Clostridia bacterium]|nr:NHLP family bacteriocin export ABC transporter peptidase/permease/ATPase [Clostridia bacterium]
MFEKRRQVRQPVKNGVAKVPVIMQMEALECGAACLAMAMAYYQKWVPLEQVRLDCGISRDGSNAKNMMLAGRHYGFEMKGYRVELESLKQMATYPCIIHWDFDHFVVLDGFRGNKAVLNDPARGVVQVDMEAFDAAFTGIVITIQPGEGFEPSGRRKSTLEFARRRLRGAGAAVVFVALTTVISYLFGIINPVMSRIFYDRLLTGRNPEWLQPFIALMALLCVVQLVVEWARAVYSLRINGKLTVIGSTAFMWKVLLLPMEFFSQRMVGDILQRQATNATIAGTLVETVAPLLLNTFMTVFYLVLMLRYSPLLTLIGLASVLINLVVARIMSEKRVNVMRVQMRDEGKLASATLAGISMTETIKASGAENGFFRKWAGYQASVNTQNVKYARMDAGLGIIPAFVSAVANYMVLFIGVYLAMHDRFTLGSITIFQGFLTAFMNPAETLIEAGQTIQEMRTQMERVEDVMQYPSDPMVRYESIREDVDYGKLRGGVELKDVCFGYAPLGKPVIQDFSM